ncbi:hypothetical protein OG21DRAFT_1319815 [Imleria badia]|nr:hypothetical protein OG21DRAFT_1319815 [Imleria badia]
MHDHPKHLKHVRGVQDAYSNAPQALEKDGVAGTSSAKGKGKSGGGNLSSDDDETQVNSDLLDSWMKRLQILTVVVRQRWCLFDRVHLYDPIKTAFLASMDGELFSLTTLNTQIGVPISTTARELVYSCLAGALIFHICATILGYTASFALLRHRIVDASGEEGTKRFPRRVVLEAVVPIQWLVTCLQGPEGLRFPAVSRFSSPPPSLSLVTRCYNTTLWLAAAGFTLALTGILAFIWAGLLMPVCIFTTICLGVGISAGVWAIAIFHVCPHTARSASMSSGPGSRVIYFKTRSRIRLVLAVAS